MLTSIVFTTVLASSALLSHAIVAPNEPGPSEVFNEGTNCHIGWTGDTASPTAWQNMTIELMTGKNEAMVHLTTVATGQDGTKDGTFNYTCPQVNPNSPIYFYQFTAPGTSDIGWTGRFTIAAANGSSTPATETEQADGQTVQWGTGALVNVNSSSAASGSAAATPSASPSTPALASSAANASTAPQTTARGSSAAVA
ncbi:hypothetical protein GGX14DRAFT_507186, partial [Mycena pura]